MAVIATGCRKATYTSARRSWQKPAQHSDLAFWGGSTEVILDEPVLIGNTIHRGKQGAGVFEAAWDSDRSVWRNRKPANPSWKERGWWRMEPRFMFEEDIYRSSAIRRGTGAAEFSGEYYRIREIPFRAAPGWTVQHLERRIVDIPITFPNEAFSGGGVRYKIDAPRLSFDLSQTGLEIGGTYVVNFQTNWDSPYAQWDVPKPKAKTPIELREAQIKLRMDPRLVIEVFEATLLQQKTGNTKKVTQPTGWVMGTGRYFGY